MSAAGFFARIAAETAKSVEMPPPSPPKHVIVMCGLPGSGKSTLATKIANILKKDAKISITDAITLAQSPEGKSEDKKLAAPNSVVIVSADDYFTKDGKYNFIPSAIGDANVTTQGQFRRAMIRKGVRAVIIDNTNLIEEHLVGYLSTPQIKAIPYVLHIVTPTTSWVNDPEECVKHCLHGVPLGVIQRMSEYREDLSKKTKASFV